MTTPPLTVHYQGGTLHGTTRRTTDDQVPATIATSSWQLYRLTGRRYTAGVLVDATYTYVGPA